MKARARALVFFCGVAATAASQTTTIALSRHVEAAQKAQARQDCVTAANEYAAAIHLVPLSGELRTNYGIALYCNKQFSDAVRELQQALTLKPDLAVPHLFLGLSDFHLSNTALAIRELETAVHRMPDDITGNVWLGYAYVAGHQPQNAIAQFASVLKLQPNNVDARYAIGETYFELGRSKARELERLAPRGRGIKLLVAEEQAAQNQGIENATGNIPAAWQSSQEEHLYDEAFEAERNARGALQIILDEAPESDRAHQIQGDAFSLQRKNEAAIREYQAALAKSPGLPGVRLALANCLMQTSQFGDALAALTEEQELQPQSADVWASTGSVQLALGRDADAVKSLQRAISLPDRPPVALLLMGKALLRLGEAKEAVPLLEEALRRGADPSTTNYFLARAYRGIGDRAAMAKALQAYNRVSVDQAERQATMTITADPKAVRDTMTAQEMHEAASMPAQEQQN